MIKTERLNIYPAEEAEMVSFIAGIEDEDLRQAYQQMLDGCLENPQQWEWYAIWMIELKDGTHIGELCFKGVDEKGVAEFGYGIVDNCQGRGYATEAVSAVTDWALGQSCVTCVTAETEESNIASRKVLGKAGFIPTGETGEEGPLYIRRKWSMETDRILLRRWRESDAEALFKYASGHVMEKCGFRDTGKFNYCSKLYGGNERPVHIMKPDYAL